jgi:uncharacterized protein YjiS (DUF1127 family)
MSLINLFVAARKGLGEWTRRHRAYDELMALDDRSLADIGIHRSQIPALVEGFDASRREAAVAQPKGPLSRLAPRQARLAGGHRWLPPI